MDATVIAGQKGTGRRMYTLVAVGAALIIFAGFARTFYLKGMFDTAPLSPLVFFHGIVMTLWFTLFIVQVRLVASGHTNLHRRLGAFGAALFVLVLLVGFATAVGATRRGAPSPVPQLTPLMWLAIPLADLVVFAILVASALWMRRRPDFHKRLMLLATLSILTPGIGRLPVDLLRSGGAPVLFGLTGLAVIVCVTVDTIGNKRLHPAFGWGGAFVVLSIPFRIAVAGSAAWTQIARWMVA